MTQVTLAAAIAVAEGEGLGDGRMQHLPVPAPPPSEHELALVVPPRSLHWDGLMHKRPVGQARSVMGDGVVVVHEPELRVGVAPLAGQKYGTPCTQMVPVVTQLAVGADVGAVVGPVEGDFVGEIVDGGDVGGFGACAPPTPLAGGCVGFGALLGGLDGEVAGGRLGADVDCFVGAGAGGVEARGGFGATVSSRTPAARCRRSWG